jgi:hypothetical protein
MQSIDGNVQTNDLLNRREVEEEVEVEENTNKKKKAAMPEPTAHFPNNLDTADFREAWGTYLQYRKDSKMKKLQAASVSRQLEELSLWGEAVAIVSINNTVRNGWTGLFQPKTHTQNNGTSNRQRDDRRIREINGSARVSIPDLC